MISEKYEILYSPMTAKRYTGSSNISRESRPCFAVAKIKEIDCLYTEEANESNYTNTKYYNNLSRFTNIGYSGYLNEHNNKKLITFNIIQLSKYEIKNILISRNISIDYISKKTLKDGVKEFLTICKKILYCDHIVNINLSQNEIKLMYDFLSKTFYTYYTLNNITNINIDNNIIKESYRTNENVLLGDCNYIPVYLIDTIAIGKKNIQYVNYKKILYHFLNNNTYQDYSNSDMDIDIAFYKKYKDKLFEVIDLFENKDLIDIIKFKFNYSSCGFNVYIYMKNDILNKILNGEKQIHYKKFDILLYNTNTFIKPLIIIHNDNLKQLYDNNVSNKNNYDGNEEFTTNFYKGYEKIKNMLNFEPFKYQVENIKWMTKLEFNADNKDNLIKYIHNNDDFKLFDFNKKKYIYSNIKSNNSNIKSNNSNIKSNNSNTDTDNYILIKPINELKKYYKSTNIKGGILADDVGLGKTLSCISNIIYHKYVNLSSQVTKDFSAKNNNINMIIVPARLVTQWYMEIKKYVKDDIYKELKICKLTVMNDIKKNNNDDFYKNDIVIVSTNLFMNANYLKYIKPIPKPTEKDTSSSVNKTSTEVSNIETTLISSIKSMAISLIGSNVNINDIKEDKTEEDKTEEAKEKEAKEKEAKEKEAKAKEREAKAKEKKAIEDAKTPLNLFNIKYKRIIMDEAHEYMVNDIKYNSEWCENLNKYEYNKNTGEYNKQHIIVKKMKGDILTCSGVDKKYKELTDKLISINSNYRWIITATPLKYSNISLNNMLKFLTKNKTNILLSSAGKIENIFGNYIRYNNKSNINNEINIPIFNEEIEYLNQTNIERRIYVHNNNNRLDVLFQLCTHISALSDPGDETTSDGKMITLTDINNIMKSKFNKSINLENKTKIDRKNELNDINENKVRYDMIMEIIKKYYDFSEITSSDILKNNFNNWLSSYKSTRDSIISEIEIYVNTCDGTNMYETFNSIVSTVQIDFKTNTQLERVFIFKCLFDYKMSKFYNKIKSLKASIEKIDSSINKINNQIKSFSGKEFIKESIQDPCSICFDEFDKEFVMTKCRHIVCRSCFDILKENKQQINCPFCRTVITNKDYSIVNVEAINKEDEKSKEKVVIEEKTPQQLKEEEMINKYGTKFNYLIKYLNKLFETPDNRVIIFSQYDRMLRMVGKVLEDFNIKHMFMKGSVHTLNKNIMKFKTDPSYKIIMLSSETSASGNNLTEANNIIFVDVINADKNRTQAIETQAIGRAVRLGQKKPVTIKRLIMKNTVEEEFYSKNKYDIKEILM